MFNTQKSLNHLIAASERKIEEYWKKLETDKDDEYNTYREMLSWFMGRRRWLLKQLIKVQLKEFIR